MELFIGKLDGDTEDAIVDVLGDQDHGWRNASPDIAVIDILNLASVMVFLQHVADREGLNGTATGHLASRFANLPWWESSIWLPLDFEPSREPAIFDDTFVGSAVGLQRDLEAIRQLSPVPLGTAPPLYETMRADQAAFARSGGTPMESQAVVQWVWLGLYDAASLAIRHVAPIQSV